MRTTIELEDDVAAAVATLRAESGSGLSAVVNDLIRRGLIVRPHREPFVQKTYAMGPMIDIDNIAEALELLDGPDAR